MTKVKPLKNGEMIGGFEIEKLLARGGQSFVYRAKGVSGSHHVVKELAPLNEVERTKQSSLSWRGDKAIFEAEWRHYFALNQTINHPVIYHFSELLEANNTLYLVGDYIPGQSLFEHLNQICFQKHMPQSRLVRLILPVIQGLNYLHKNGLVHGDIKPANLYITLENKILLLDGINDGSGRPDFSQGFSAPEVEQNKTLSNKSDYYSLGVLIAYLMTGDKVNANKQLVGQIDYDDELSAFVQTCLNPAPSHRPDNLKKLVDVIKYLQSPQSSALETSTVKLTRKAEPQNRSKLLLPYAAAIFAILIGSGLWFSWPVANQQESADPVMALQDEAETFNSHNELPIAVETAPVAEPIVVSELSSPKLRNIPVDEPNDTTVKVVQKPPMPKVIATLLENMVRFPAGEFWLGSSNGTAAELPVRKVKVAGFKLLNHEVSYALYNQCVADKMCRAPSVAGSSNQPVAGVSFDDIQNQFIPWLNNLSEITFRLPSEVEWEYGAKLGVGEGYVWGSARLSGAANCRDCDTDFGGRKSAPVKSFPPSKAGLFDMNGNVEEWVADCWTTNHESSADSGCTKVTVKGGNWDSRFSAIRNSARRGENSNRRSSVLGFRLALSAEENAN